MMWHWRPPRVVGEAAARVSNSWPCVVARQRLPGLPSPAGVQSEEETPHFDSSRNIALGHQQRRRTAGSGSSTQSAQNARTHNKKEDLRPRSLGSTTSLEGLPRAHDPGESPGCYLSPKPSHSEIAMCKCRRSFSLVLYSGMSSVLKHVCDVGS